MESDVDVMHALEEFDRRVLWLSTAVVDHANRVRPNTSGVKVGGHQASCASMTSLMSTLWALHLRPEDRVSVKPHAGPVLHAINYLLGGLEADYLTRLRSWGGLQSYPSRTKDPDRVDYSTGSVGIGATAPIWGAVAKRFVAHRFAVPAGGRQYSLLGDAELDEGAIWEALLDPVVPTLGELVWIVDLNRQSLDRVVPHTSTRRYVEMFRALGWQVIVLKYGRRLEELFRRPGGSALRARLDAMTNGEYQRLLRCAPAELRRRLLDGAGPHAAGVDQVVRATDDETLVAAVRNLAGHDLDLINRALLAIDDHRPTVILAYTIKGYRLPSEGHPHNHSRLLDATQMDALAADLGVTPATWWDGFAPGTPAGDLCAAARDRLERLSVPRPELAPVPAELGRTPPAVSTTQAALGRVLLDLSRADPALSARVVTVSPDVSSSTNLGGWVNKVGVWSTGRPPDWFDDDAETVLHWRESPSGQHIELGIAETNLVGLLAELGSTWSRWGQRLLPIGVVYDPFVERALEPWSFGIYAGGQSILVGSPSGVSLAPEGGAHQSIKTPSIGVAQPGCVAYEPAFAQEVEWILLAAMDRLGRPDGTSSYLRLNTRPVRQSLAAVPDDPAARDRRRRLVLAGGYRLRSSPGAAVSIAAMGATVPEALAAADRMQQLGVTADVVCVTSADLLYRAHQARTRGGGDPQILEQLFPRDRATPLVTLLDGHPHTLSFLAVVNGVPSVNLGVTQFGQSGDLADVYAYHGIDADSVVKAALDLID